MRTLVIVATLVAAALPQMALAQPPGPPAAELGVQISKKIDDPGGTTWSPRITLNLSPLTAIEGAADIRQPHLNEFGTRTTSRGFSVHWRQRLFASGRWQIYGVLGGGVSRIEQDVPERIIQGRDGPEVFPRILFIDTEPVVHLGPAVQLEAAPWLALRGDVRLTIGDNNGGLRGMIGAVVPLGRFRAGDRSTASTSAPLAAWQRVKPGREVWVTTSSGELVHGEVAEVSGRNLSIRRKTGDVSLVLDDVRIVEGRDSLKNGILIGGAAGAAAGATLFTWAARVFCESDSCESFEGAAFVLGGSAGFAVGGLIGAMVDSAISGRRTLYERSSVRGIPVATRQQKSLGVVVSWR